MDADPDIDMEASDSELDLSDSDTDSSCSDEDAELGSDLEDDDAEPVRSHKKQCRLAPAEDTDLAFAKQGPGQRWSVKTVNFVLFLMLKHFNVEQYCRFRDDDAWPLTNAQSTAMLKDVAAQVNVYLDEHDPGEEVPRLDPAAKPWRQTAREWLRRHVQKGSIHWRLSNPPGAMLKKLGPVLDELDAMLVQGFRTPEKPDEVLLFRDTEEAARINPAFAAIVEKHKLTNPRRLWRLLKQNNPKLRRTKQPIKKERDAIKTQA